MEKPLFLDFSTCMCSYPICHSLYLSIFSFLILVKTSRISSRITSPCMLSSFEHKVFNLTACGWEWSPPVIWPLSDFWPTASVTYRDHVSHLTPCEALSICARSMWDTSTSEAWNHRETGLCTTAGFFLHMLQILKMSPVSQIFNVGIIFLLR